MDEAELRRLLAEVTSGAVSADDAVARLARLPFGDLGHARVDHHRALRQGQAECVYGPGKRPGEVVDIVGELLAQPGELPVLVTRADQAQMTATLAAHPDGTAHGDGDEAGLAGGAGGPSPDGDAPTTRRTLVWRPAPPRPETVAVVTAGTADRPVAEECVATLVAFGFDPVRIHDAGVAGLHRLLASLDDIVAADAVIVVAGMEGALASVVGGLTGAPVIAVPTSVGYGAGLEGVTALLAMHASCAAGVTVVGIDNGYGAASGAVRALGPADRADRTRDRTGG